MIQIKWIARLILQLSLKEQEILNILEKAKVEKFTLKKAEVKDCLLSKVS